MSDATNLPTGDADNRSVNDDAATAGSFLGEMFDSLPVVVYRVKPYPPYAPIYISPAIEKFGYQPSEWFNRPDFWQLIIHPEDRARILRETQAAFAAREAHEYEYRIVAPDGKVRWIYDQGQFIFDSVTGEAQCWQGVMLEVSSRKQAESELQLSEERFRRAVDNAAIGMALVAPDGRWLRVNQALRELLAYSEEELLATSFQAVTHPDDLDADLEYVRQMLAGEIKIYQMEKRYMRRDQSVAHCLLSVSLVRSADDAPLYFISQIQDITEQKRAEEKLREWSLTDELTGLYNRRGFLALAGHQLKLAAGKRLANKLLFFYIDLDGLKQINDQFGHETGSRLIQNAGQILKRSFRQSDLIARLGGDEFVVLAIEAATDSTELMLDRLEHNLAEYNAAGNKSSRLQLSIGATRFEPATDRTIEDALSRADQLMYREKNQKKNRLFS